MHSENKNLSKEKNVRAHNAINKIKLAFTSRTKFELILLAILLIFSGFFWAFKPYSSKNTSSSTGSNATSQKLVVQSEPSKETMVSPAEIASRVDYSRQIISVKNGKVNEFKIALQKIGGTIIDEIAPDVFVIGLSKDKHEQDLQSLQNTSLVSGAEVDYPLSITAETAEWGVQKINAPLVWPTATGTGVKVAILDTGVDGNHTEIYGRVAAGRNFVNDNDNYNDVNGHGTHVAGIAAAAKNGSGVIGASYGASLLIGKVLGDDGVGYVSDVVEGINWAIQNGAKVINLSLGSTARSTLLEDAVNRAAANGAVVVVAAGNNYGGPLLYPAAYGSVISVGASDSNNRLASFSAIGASVVAPGVGILSSVPGNNYASWSGTSMASPHVAGVAALLISQGESDVKKKILDTATDLGAAGYDGIFGYGLVNAKIAASNIDLISPLVTIISPKDGSLEKGSVRIEASVTDESGISKVMFTIDNQNVGEFVAGPYTSTMPVNKIGSGSHTLLVSATDKKGNVGESKAMFVIEDKNNKSNAKSDPSPTLSTNSVQTSPEVDANTIPTPPTQTNIKERNQQAQPKNDKADRKQSFLENLLSAVIFWT